MAGLILHLSDRFKLVEKMLGRATVIVTQTSLLSLLIPTNQPEGSNAVHFDHDLLESLHLLLGTRAFGLMTLLHLFSLDIPTIMTPERALPHFSHWSYSSVLLQMKGKRTSSVITHSFDCLLLSSRASQSQVMGTRIHRIRYRREK